MENLRTQSLEGASTSDSLSMLITEEDKSSATLKAEKTENTAELPLVVWLKGDEPYFDDFHVDAEEAMRILGIKRTRLTQISGHELRVARIRVDRYIKPYYRMADLNEYLSWTRPTASHQKSSQAIQDAVSVLEEKTVGFLESFKETENELNQKLSILSQSIGAQISGQEIVLRESVNKLQELIHATKSNFEGFLSESWGNWKQWQSSEMHRIEASMQATCEMIKNRSDHIETSLARLSERQDEISEDLKSLQAAWTTSQELHSKDSQLRLKNSELQKQFLLSLHGIQQEILKRLDQPRNKNGALKLRRLGSSRKIQVSRR